MASDVFDSQFIFGGASAGHHVEGDLHDDWTAWLPDQAIRLGHQAPKKNHGQGIAPNLPNEALDPENYMPSVGADHYHRYKEDLFLAGSELGLTGFRFSVEWSRIQPISALDFDVKAIEHYHRVARMARVYGMEPFVTLNHFTLPQWAAELGGWRSPAVVAAFGRYAERMAADLENVKYFATLNEPETYAMMTSAPAPVIQRSDAWLDYPKGIRHYSHMRRQLVKAHRRAAAGINIVRPDALVGITLNHTYYDGSADPAATATRWLGKRITNDYFAEHVADSCDWLGLQYYFHCRVNGLKLFANEFERESDLGWELFPWGIEPLLHRMNRYGKPIYVTESGLADAVDWNRLWYIKETLRCIARAVVDGVDCRGYFHFSLTDGSEWDKGRWVRTGLIGIDYETGERFLRSSARQYAKIIANRSL